MSCLDTTIVNVALPHIEADLGISTAMSQWVVLAYLVPLIGLSLLSGRWLDVIGRRPSLTLAATGFAVTSVAAGLAPSATLLVVARAAQGGFGALLLALAPVLAVGAVRASARGRALGIVGTLAPLGAMSGPVLGGWLVDTVGWSWVFHATAPIAALLVVLGVRWLPRGTGLRPPRGSWLVEAVVLGTAALAVLLTSTLVVDGSLRWAALSLVALPLLAWWRRMSVARPVRGLLATPGMAAVHVAFVSGYAVMLLVQFLMPFFLAQSLQTSATATGLTLLALPSATAATGALGGALADRLGGRLVALAGAGTIATGVALLLPLSTEWMPGSVAWRLAALGVGFGLFLSPSMSLAMQFAPRQLLGVAAASTNLARFVGLALGPAAATTIWAASDYRLAGMRAALVFALTASLVAASALLRVSRREPGSQPAEPRERSAPHAAPPITTDDTHLTDSYPRSRSRRWTSLSDGSMPSAHTSRRFATPSCTSARRARDPQRHSGR